MSTYIPNGERVVVLATEGGEVLLVLGEGETLNQHLVQFEALQRLQSVEVPDDDVRLQKVRFEPFARLFNDFVLTAASDNGRPPLRSECLPRIRSGSSDHLRCTFQSLIQLLQKCRCRVHAGSAESWR